MNELPNGHLIFARRSFDNAIVGVLDVPNGLGCGCVCPDCGAPLCAKQGPNRAPHFSHKSQSTSCGGMGWWHEVIRDCLGGLRWIDLGSRPPIPRIAGVQRILAGHCEYRVLEDQFRPDVLLQLQSGLNVAVEVVDTSEIDGFKLLALEQELIFLLRIDVAMVKLSVYRAGATIRGLAAILETSGPWQSWPHSRPAVEQGALELRRRWPGILRYVQYLVVD